ncbi:alpha/beta hydrolase [Clostridium sp. Marseille-P2415]|uniref:alpha/beta hydrolase n=1 Tax=Clostridium sp. Marseille-P2415 TaxID=1805471 RepID=UPI0009885730|nr:alpha/beta hydrolase [Clostridium sp. Marseille-P2415]
MITQKEITLNETSYPVKATIYQNTDIVPRACVLYFHGGGLLYGSRLDLPELHLNSLTDAGCVIISYDYPLAPAVKIDFIINNVVDSINHYVKHPMRYAARELPYFLWGRSAGAYLCLLASASGRLLLPPNGILSYYGYGFLCDSWFSTPSKYYCTLPAVPESCLLAVSDRVHTEGDLDTHYSIYVYARQTGTWKSLFYDGRDKCFFLDYSLRACDKLPAPLFCAHSINDTDVPYSEFLELCGKYRAEKFIVSRAMHDFDRDETDSLTVQLLKATVHFLEIHLI